MKKKVPTPNKVTTLPMTAMNNSLAWLLVTMKKSLRKRYSRQQLSSRAKCWLLNRTSNEYYENEEKNLKGSSYRISFCPMITAIVFNFISCLKKKSKLKLCLGNASEPLTLFSDFWAACGTMIGSSRSVVNTFPRLPRLKIVERFFRGCFEEKNPANRNKLE